jgi:hypothetical protein
LLSGTVKARVWVRPGFSVSFMARARRLTR